MTEVVVLHPFEDRSVKPPVSRTPGERLDLDDDKVDRWSEKGLVKATGGSEIEDWPWGTCNGAELHSVFPPPGGRKWNRVVACLNIWNDLESLQQTLPTWIDHVDHVVAVDGPYAWKGWHDLGVRESHSIDGTLELLYELGDKSTVIIQDIDHWWPDQLAKRNAYLEACCSGDLVFVVDADEEVHGAECLRDLEGFDVGWVRLEYQAIYKRRYRQPRLFHWRPGLKYEGRHHWMKVGPKLLTTHQYAGPGWHHAAVPMLIKNLPDARPIPRQILRAGQRRGQVKLEAKEVAASESDQKVGARESLRIVQLSLYDAGMVVSRLQTAINTTTPHSSLYGGYKERDAFQAPKQFDVGADAMTLRQACREADFIHCHLNLYPLMQLGEPAPRPPVILHHHGTMYRKAHEWHNERSRLEAAVVLVSNLELLNYASEEQPLHFLPNPVPVAVYRRMAREATAWPWRDTPGAQDDDFKERPMLVGHSPSKTELKGTMALQRAVRRLRKKGLNIEVELIHRVSHEESLKRKASCDVCFDSFWLGMQCSGLEAGAMGQPVLAGTGDGIHDRYVQWVGQVPYTAVEDGETLELALERLYIDGNYRRQEGQRVQEFITKHHDFAPVALKYLEILDEATAWRDRLAV